jgi:uncharacterized membrane protein
MKYNNKWLFITPALLIMVLSRYILEKYGSEANDKFGLVIAGLVIVMFTVGIVYFMVKKYYWISIGMGAIFIPLMMGLIGAHTGNQVLSDIGLLLVIMVMCGIYIFLKLHVKNKNK